MYIKLKRGMLRDIPQKFEPYEAFYVTDLRMMGVADDKGNPQLLVEVLEFDTKDDFPEDGLPHKLYQTSEKELFFFDGERYLNVAMSITPSGTLPFFQGKRQSIKIKLEDKK